MLHNTDYIMERPMAIKFVGYTTVCVSVTIAVKQQQYVRIISRFLCLPPRKQ